MAASPRMDEGVLVRGERRVEEPSRNRHLPERVVPDVKSELVTGCFELGQSLLDEHRERLARIGPPRSSSTEEAERHPPGSSRTARRRDCRPRRRGRRGRPRAVAHLLPARPIQDYTQLGLENDVDLGGGTNAAARSKRFTAAS